MKMATNQQFSLRWNNYVHHITCAFDSLRSDEDLVDVTLSCEGRKILAHKMLLSACSTYFKNVFKENPCKHPVIIFRNVRFEDLVAIVDFMYHGEVNVEQEQLSSFLTTAEMLAVQGLTDGSGPKETQKDELQSRKRQQQSLLESSLLSQELSNNRQPNHHQKSTPRSNSSYVPASVPASYHPQPPNRPNTPTSIPRKRKFSPVKVVNSVSNRDGGGVGQVADAAEPRSAVNKKRAVMSVVKEEIETTEPVVPKLEVTDYEDNDSSYSDHESGMMDMSQLLEKGGGPGVVTDKEVAEMFNTNSRDSPHPNSKADIPGSEIDKEGSGIQEQAILKPGTSGNVDSMQETYFIAYVDDNSDEDEGEEGEQEEYLDTVEDEEIEEVDEIEEMEEVRKILEGDDEEENDSHVEGKVFEEKGSYVLVGDGDSQGDEIVKFISEDEPQENIEYIYAEGVNDNEIIIGQVPRFSCKYCKASYKRLDSLYKHNSVHRGQTKCPVCSAVFSRVGHRTRHMRIKHPDVELRDEEKPRRGRRRKTDTEEIILPQV